MHLRPEAFDSPSAQILIAAVQQEYLRRYGGVDDAPTDPAEFAPPAGYFVVAWLGSTPVGCGGWRAHPLPEADRPVAEIKRMYVSEAARRRGIARLILADLERSAVAAGYPTLILETGGRLPEAVALYRAAGYRPIAPFGFYQDSPDSHFYGKDVALQRAEHNTDE
jgi:GNAT superfamily N-acetyltransferase